MTDGTHANALDIARLQGQIALISQRLEREQQDLEQERAERKRLERRLMAVERVLTKASFAASIVIGLSTLVGAVISQWATIRDFFRG